MFDYTDKNITFWVDELEGKKQVTREFLLTPKINGDLEIIGAEYSYETETKDEEISSKNLFKGTGSNLDLKIYPYAQYRLMCKWGFHEYMYFSIGYMPLAAIPMCLWLAMYFVNRKKKELPDSSSSKSKSDKTAKTAAKHKKK